MCFSALPTSCPRFPQCDHVTGPQVEWKQAWLTALAALLLPYLRGGLCSCYPPRLSSPPHAPHCRHQRRCPGRWIPSMFSGSLTHLRPVWLQRQARAGLRLKSPGLGDTDLLREALGRDEVVTSSRRNSLDCSPAHQGARLSQCK